MSSTITTPTGKTSPTERPAHRGDFFAISAILLLIAIVSLNRAIFDSWIVRHDILTQYLPWYRYLGQELRSFNIPGWNPFQFSGTHFAGDPQSGWMYLPIMLPFALFDAPTALKVAMTLELIIAGLGAYALARVIGLRPLGSTMTAVVFTFGALLFHATYCCTVRVQLAIWIPVAMLGIELALRSTRRVNQLAAILLAAFALSQMIAGWLGQGTMNGYLVIFSFLGYRALISPPRPIDRLSVRFIWAAVIGGIMASASLALSAAGLLPRIAVNPETNLAGGNYDGVGGGYSVPPLSVRELLGFLISDDYGHREMSFTAVALILACLAPFLARRTLAMPYFTGLTLVTLILALPVTPLHHLFFLIPKWRELHEHNVPHVTTVVAIGPAMLAGVTIDRLPHIRGRIRRPWLLCLPLAAFTLAALLARNDDTPLRWSAFAAATLTTLIVLIAAVPEFSAKLSERSTGPVVRWAGVMLIAFAFLQPTGLELVDASAGTRLIAGWESTWRQPADRATGETINMSATDPGGAGEFLQTQLAAGEPFRYVGYGGLGYDGDRDRAKNYTLRRFDPNVQAILVNGRAIFLGLYDVQGYNPVQLRRYVDFITLINGKTQDYHHANIRPTGIGNPLLELLNVRFVLLDASIPSDRDDVQALIADRHEVFRNDLVIVYESNHPLAPVWIVHDVVEVPNGDVARDAISELTFDPAQTAVVEGNVAALTPSDPNGVESAVVTRYDPDQITVQTQSATGGFLVFSEVVAKGWVAHIDGDVVPILNTDFVLRGIQLPAGEHTVTMSYELRSLRIGVVITAFSSALTLIVWVIAAVTWVRRRRPCQSLSTV